MMHICWMWMSYCALLFGVCRCLEGVGRKWIFCNSKVSMWKLFQVCRWCFYLYRAETVNSLNHHQCQLALLLHCCVCVCMCLKMLFYAKSFILRFLIFLTLTSCLTLYLYSLSFTCSITFILPNPLPLIFILV